MKTLKLNWLALFTFVSLLSWANVQEAAAQCTLQVFANPVTNATCPNEPDGTISALGIFGTPPYTCVWTDDLGIPVQTNAGLNQGQASNFTSARGGITYTATFTDATGTCSAFATVATGVDFAVCADTELRVGYCGRTLANFNTYLKCYSVPGADLYEFRFVNAASGFDQTVQGLWHNPLITSFVFVPGASFNLTYDVTVRARVGGQFGPFGQVCQVSTPNIATTTLRLGHCGTTVSGLTSMLKCYIVYGATDYDWRFVNGAAGFDQTVSTTNERNSFYHVPGIQPNTTYDVTVRGRNGATIGTYGNVCKVTTPNFSLLTPIGDDIQEGSATRSAAQTPSGLSPTTVMYPNPNNGDELRISIANLADKMHNANVEIFNVAGQQVYSKTFSRDGSFVEGVVRFDTKLETGMYIVRINVGEYNFVDKLLVD